MTVDEEAEIRQRLKGDFAHYAERCLVIRAKTGGPVTQDEHKQRDMLIAAHLNHQRAKPFSGRFHPDRRIAGGPHHVSIGVSGAKRFSDSYKRNCPLG